MSKSAPESPETPIEEVGRICIVASRYNSTYTDALVHSARETLERLAPKIEITITRVPGAFEIPVVVEAHACSDIQPLAIIALGVIIRGATAHADLIASSITESLQHISIDNLLPVIHEVLLVNDAGQAETRSLGDEMNRGREAAESAVAMIEVMRDLD